MLLVDGGGEWEKYVLYFTFMLFLLSTPCKRKGKSGVVREAWRFILY